MKIESLEAAKVHESPKALPIQNTAAPCPFSGAAQPEGDECSVKIESLEAAKINEN